ncbi:MAG: hypothetical protein MK105_13425 [Crocinitomicaceae bacterium]|nr:hypothetical protein [Crocinitomicaceae bacterium]
MTPLIDDKNLKIQLLSYNRPTADSEQYYFLEMSTLQATTLLPHDKKIISNKIFAYTDDDNYLDENTTDNFKNIGQFNDFFVTNPDFYIHNCDMELEDGISLSSHDDGEVSIQFLRNDCDQKIIIDIFNRYKLDKKIISILKNKLGHYIAIDEENNITGDYKNFDDYLKFGRS